jgi:gamma-glutamyltranspeptidase
MLNILETFNLTAMGHNTADYLHVHIEAKKLAFADRAKFYGDPDFGEPTAELIEWLVSKEYGRERAKLINMGRYAARSTQLIGPHWLRVNGGASFPRAFFSMHAYYHYHYHYYHYYHYYYHYHHY